MPDTRLWDGGAGENNILTAANWTAHVAPVSTDTVGFPAQDQSDTTDIAGTDSFVGVLIADWIVEKGCKINVGSRLTPLTIDCDYFEYWGEGEDAHYEIKNCALAQIFNTGSGGAASSYGLHLTGGVGAVNTKLIISANSYNTIALAYFAGQTLTWGTVEVRSGKVYIGSGAVITTLATSGGETISDRNLTTLNVDAGKVTVGRTATVTTANIRGRVVYNSSGTITTLNLYPGGILDATENVAGFTITNEVNLYRGGQIIDPHKRITFGDGATIAEGGTLKLT